MTIRSIIEVMQELSRLRAEAQRLTAENEALTAWDLKSAAEIRDLKLEIQSLRADNLSKDVKIDIMELTIDKLLDHLNEVKKSNTDRIL